MPRLEIEDLTEEDSEFVRGFAMDTGDEVLEVSVERDPNDSGIPWEETYEYDVSDLEAEEDMEQLFRNFRNAESFGVFFNENVKDEFPVLNDRS